MINQPKPKGLKSFIEFAIHRGHKPVFINGELKCSVCGGRIAYMTDKVCNDGKYHMITCDFTDNCKN